MSERRKEKDTKKKWNENPTGWMAVWAPEREGKLNGVFIDVTFYWKNKRKKRGRRTLFGENSFVSIKSDSRVRSMIVREF